MNTKRIIFAGAGKLALETFKTLESFYKIVLVLTYSLDGQNEFFDYVSEKYYNVSTSKPNIKTINRDNNYEDILISVNYKFIFSKEFLNLFSHAINVHGSLLPKYRGRSPHIWAIINGEKETGVTCHRMKPEVDQGEILEQIKIAIDSDDSGADLIDKFCLCYPRVVMNALDKIDSYSGIVQNEDEASYYGIRTEIMSFLDLNKPVEEVINFIRALRSPYPNAYHFLPNGKRISITRVIVSNARFMSFKGIRKIEGKYILSCLDGYLEVTDYEFVE
jgi:methionyl-tRNA formyltransferase